METEKACTTKFGTTKKAIDRKIESRIAERANAIQALMGEKAPSLLGTCFIDQRVTEDTCTPLELVDEVLCFVRRYGADSLVEIKRPYEPDFNVYWLRMAGPDSPTASFVNSLMLSFPPSTVSNLYYLYECRGAHYGKSIAVAVKNPRWELDGDEEGDTQMVIDHDGLFWADDFKPLHDDTDDAYSDVIMEALREDLSS